MLVAGHDPLVLLLVEQEVVGGLVPGVSAVLEEHALGLSSCSVGVRLALVDNDIVVVGGDVVERVDAPAAAKDNDGDHWNGARVHPRVLLGTRRVPVGAEQLEFGRLGGLRAEDSACSKHVGLWLWWCLGGNGYENCLNAFVCACTQQVKLERVWI